MDSDPPAAEPHLEKRRKSLSAQLTLKLARSVSYPTDLAMSDFDWQLSLGQILKSPCPLPSHYSPPSFCSIYPLLSLTQPWTLAAAHQTGPHNLSNLFQVWHPNPVQQHSEQAMYCKFFTQTYSYYVLAWVHWPGRAQTNANLPNRATP